MKKSSASRKTLGAIKEALRLGLPLSGAVVAAACLTGAAPGQAPAKAGNQAKEASKSSAGENEPKKTVSIDTMSLSYRRWTTCGIMYPSPTVVQVKCYTVKAGDTWESLAKRYRTTVEIMMRINDVPAKTVYEVISAKKIPENLKLRSGQRIYVPVPGQRSLSEYERDRKIVEEGREEMERLEKERKTKSGEPSPASADKPKKVRLFRCVPEERPLRERPCIPGVGGLY